MLAYMVVLYLQMDYVASSENAHVGYTRKPVKTQSILILKMSFGVILYDFKLSNIRIHAVGCSHGVLLGLGFLHLYSPRDNL